MTKSNGFTEHSATTGMPLPAPTPESAIGWLLSAAGSEGKATAGRRIMLAPVRSTEVPADTEHLDKLDGLPSLLRSCMRASSERTVISASRGYEGTWPERVQVRIDPPAEAVSEARRALVAYEGLNRPLADEDLAIELTRLREVTKATRESGGEFAVGLDTMMDELADKPADLVLWAIRFWRRCEKFYPTPSELHLLIERRLTGRRAIMDGLRRLIANGEARAAE